MGVLRPVLASNRNVFALERVDVLLKFKEEGTFTRASNATVWKNKVLTTVGANEPRFETDPLTGRALGLRVERARTNMWQYGTTLNGWNSAANVDFRRLEALSPDGTVNASVHISDTSTGLHWMGSWNTPSITAGAKFSMSGFLKRVGKGSNNRYFKFAVRNSSWTAAVGFYVDLEEGIIQQRPHTQELF